MEENKETKNVIPQIAELGRLTQLMKEALTFPDLKNFSLGTRYEYFKPDFDEAENEIKEEKPFDEVVADIREAIKNGATFSTFAERKIAECNKESTVDGKFKFIEKFIYYSGISDDVLEKWAKSLYDSIYTDISVIDVSEKKKEILSAICTRKDCFNIRLQGGYDYVGQGFERIEVNRAFERWDKLYSLFEKLVTDASAKEEKSFDEAEAINQAKKYSDGLLNLFHGNIDLIEQLNGLSDNEIAIQIRSWKTQKDKMGRPLIENPDNYLKSEYARELKENGLIKCNVNNFRNKL